MIQKPDHVHVVDAPDAFRGKFTGKTAARDYAEQVNQVLEENKGKVAAYIGWDCKSRFGTFNERFYLVTTLLFYRTAVQDSPEICERIILIKL